MLILCSSIQGIGARAYGNESGLHIFDKEQVTPPQKYTAKSVSEQRIAGLNFLPDRGSDGTAQKSVFHLDDWLSDYASPIEQADDFLRADRKISQILEIMAGIFLFLCGFQFFRWLRRLAFPSKRAAAKEVKYKIIREYKGRL